jgi:signal peptidase II
MQRRGNASLFWPILFVVAIVDVITKGIAERELVRGIPHEVLGNSLRFTLVYNPGAAFGLNLGPQSRWIFAALTVVALAILGRLYRSTRPGHVARTVSLAFVCAGAVGNLLDRMRSIFGVVDFIDVGIGDARWPTFNVADMAVSVGAGLLAWVLWQEDREARADEAITLVASTTSATVVTAVASPSSGAESVDVA